MSPGPRLKILNVCVFYFEKVLVLHVYMISCVCMCYLGLHECLTKMCEYMYYRVCVLLKCARIPNHNRDIFLQ